MANTDPFDTWVSARTKLSMTPRVQQDDLFRTVVARMVVGGTPVVEAPCGIGKSAIVIPVAALRDVVSPKGRVIVSTSTKAQQAQLVDVARRASEAEVITGKVLELRGRANYLCHVRRKAAKLPPIVLPSRAAGFRTDCPPMDDDEWDLSCSDEDGCSADTCGDLDHYQIARAAAMTPGSLVIVNHHILALDQRLGGALIGVGPEDLLVIDEAHQLGDVVRSVNGAVISPSRLKRLRKRAMDVAGHHVAAVPSELDTWLAKRIGREQYVFVDDAALIPREVSAWAARVEQACGDVAKLRTDDVKAAAMVAMAAGRLINDVAAFDRAPTEPNLVRYIEGGPKYPRAVVKPMEVGHITRGIRHGAFASVAMSATLAGYPESELGTSPGDLIVAPNVFDMRNQRAGHYVANVDPGSPEQMDILTEAVLSNKTSQVGGALILASTKPGDDGLSDVARVARHLRRAGLRVGEQESTRDVDALAAGLRDRSLDVVVGTAALREGIDLPGNACTLVVLMSLPWPYMNDALLEARCRKLGDRGKWPGLLVPMMLTNTAQAVGRLIRTTDDFGDVLLMDGRPGSVRHLRQVMSPSGVRAYAAGSIVGVA